MVSVFLTGILTSVVTAVITSLVCLILRKRQVVKDATHNTSASAPPIYDTVETTGNEKFDLTRNAAYAHVSVQS